MHVELRNPHHALLGFCSSTSEDLEGLANLSTIPSMVWDTYKQRELYLRQGVIAITLGPKATTDKNIGD